MEEKLNALEANSSYSHSAELDNLLKHNQYTKEQYENNLEKANITIT
jgi:hypothetical protein